MTDEKENSSQKLASTFCWVALLSNSQKKARSERDAACTSLSKSTCQNVNKIKRSYSRKTQNGKKSSDLTENNTEIIKMKIEVELIRGSKGYGITIAGGTLHQYHPGDNGIYVTRYSYLNFKLSLN